MSVFFKVGFGSKSDYSILSFLDNGIDNTARR